MTNTKRARTASAATTMTSRSAAEKAIDMSKSDKSSTWSKPTGGEKADPEPRPESPPKK